MYPKLTHNREPKKSENSTNQRPTIKVLEQFVDETGINPDPDKIHAIQKMKTPSNIS